MNFTKVQILEFTCKYTEKENVSHDLMEGKRAAEQGKFLRKSLENITAVLQKNASSTRFI